MALDLGSFFNSSAGTTSGSGKAGGAGYSSDVTDSGKTATDVSVVVGGIGTTSANQGTGVPLASVSGAPSNTLLYIAVAVLFFMVLRR